MEKHTKTLHLWDRSRAVTDWKCPRARYWNYEHKGIGVAPSNTSLELFLGSVIHDSLATLATLTRAGDHVDINAITALAKTQIMQALAPEGSGYNDLDFALEQSSLIEGMLRGFHRSVWPRLLSQYPRILLIEEELLYEHDGLGFMSKPDLVLGNDETAVYVEYKSTSSKKDTWINSWDTAVQLHSTMRAIKVCKGIEVGGVIIQGLYKGYESYGKQSSPFCYAYKKNGNPPFSKNEITLEYKPGAKRFPVWELDGGTKAWVDSMDSNVLAEQFPQTPMIYMRDDLVDSFFKQRAIRESDINSASYALAEIERRLASPDLDPEAINRLQATRQVFLDSDFPQKFDQCQPGWGKPCGFKQLCFGNVVNPLTQGFELRIPHHPTETERLTHKPLVVDGPDGYKE